MTSKRQIILYLACLALILTGWAISCHAEHSASNQNRTDANGMPAAEALLEVQIPDDVPSIMIQYPGFDVSFNPTMHQPNYSAWELTRQETYGDLPRAKNFQADNDVLGSAQPADYKNSGYDRGHMAPAADMKWDSGAMEACFRLTNICPQHNKLNSGAWKSLEERCRDWARRDSSLIIICGPVLTDKLTNTIGATEIPVPHRFFKVILAPYANPPRAIGFIMNNGRVDGGMQAAATTVDEVEAITGYDFFSALPDEIENRIESESKFATWTRK